MEAVALAPAAGPTVFPYGEEPTKSLSFTWAADSVSFGFLPLVVENMLGC